MATKRDQVQSYQFLLQRIISALVYRKTDPAQSPFRKAGGAVFAGVAITILALGVTAVLQIFNLGGQDRDWRDGGLIVLEEGTGAQYVVFPRKEHLEELQKAGKKIEPMLYPVRNFASAALLAGTTETIEVDQEDLMADGLDENIPARGMTVGIMDLPDSLPKPDTLLGPGWAVCSDPNREALGKKDASSVLFVGTQPAKGDELQPGATAARSDEVIIVKDREADVIYLVTNNHKHKISNPNAVLSALNLGIEPVEVAPAFIKAIPAGQDLSIPSFSEPGSDSSIAGAKVGDVFKSDVGDNVSYHVVLKDGAAPISALQANLIMADLQQDSFRTGSEARNAATNDKKYQFEFLPDREDSRAVKQAIPQAIPRMAEAWDPQQATCVAFKDAKSDVAVLVNADIPDKQGIYTQQVSNDSTTYADRIVIPANRGMLVQTGESVGAVALVTADGKMFPFAAESGDDLGVMAVGGIAARAALGYSEAKPVTLPVEIAGLIPYGPELNPAAAARQVLEDINAS